MIDDAVRIAAAATRAAALAALVLAGACARPTEAVYQQPWNGQDSSWDPPPARVVSDRGSGGGAGAGVGQGSGGGGNLPVCTKSGQVNCCYDDKPGSPSGVPKCSWRRLAPGESTVVSTAFQMGPDVPVPLPVVVQLTSASPERFATYDECLNAPIGFVLSGPGLKEGRLGGDIQHYDLKTDGTWVGRGGGGQSGLVAGRDTEVTSRDGGAPAPSYTLHEGLCKPLMAPEFSASIQFFDQVDFTINGIEYRANFRSAPNGSAKITGYYVVIQKGF